MQFFLKAVSLLTSDSMLTSIWLP